MSPCGGAEFARNQRPIRCARGSLVCCMRPASFWALDDLQEAEVRDPLVQADGLVHIFPSCAQNAYAHSFPDGYREDEVHAIDLENAIASHGLDASITVARGVARPSTALSQIGRTTGTSVGHKVSGSKRRVSLSGDPGGASRARHDRDAPPSLVDAPLDEQQSEWRSEFHRQHMGRSTAQHDIPVATPDDTGSIERPLRAGRLTSIVEESAGSAANSSQALSPRPPRTSVGHTAAVTAASRAAVETQLCHRSDASVSESRRSNATTSAPISRASLAHSHVAESSGSSSGKLHLTPGASWGTEPHSSRACDSIRSRSPSPHGSAMVDMGVVVSHTLQASAAGRVVNTTTPRRLPPL